MTSQSSDEKRNPDQSRLLLARMVKETQENLLAIEDLHRINCRLIRVKYEALIEQGFTVDQALVLCRI